MKTLGIIPARGGSKAIPRKNLVPLLDRPLLSYTCNAARRSSLQRVILSTDDPEIAAFARTQGIEVPFMRPPELAADATSMLDVVQHALKTCEADVVVLLQPTSPLRTATHIDEALALLARSGVDTVVSVTEVPHQYAPTSLMTLTDGLLKPFSDGTPILRRQDKPRFYARNGPAVLVTKREVVEGGSLYGARIAGYEMDRRSSIDIDDAHDLLLAEFWLTH